MALSAAFVARCGAAISIRRTSGPKANIAEPKNGLSRGVLKAMKLSSTTTPEACFAQFWKLLRAPKPEIWREYRAAIQGRERQREALELLASVVWHLELAHSLALWPKQKMQDFYSKLLDTQLDALTPWKIWVDHYNKVKVTPSAVQILIDSS
jgi:hypothetical protein